jgi:hypothetical protein
MSAPSPAEDSPRAPLMPALTVYLRPRVLIVMLLGFSSGLPLALSGETLRVWMADAGVDLGTIGLLTLAGLPYTLKFLWAPAVDAWNVPFLSRRLGRRRGWLIASQLLLMAAALLVLVGLAATLLAREPAAPSNAEADDNSGALSRLYETARGAFSNFFMRDAAIAILAFVVLFKLCDAFAGTMTAPFVLSLGYSKATYAAIVKGVGLGALLIGGFAGGAVARALPLATALWIAAFLQMFSNLVFVWLGWQPPGPWALTVAIVIENFAGAIGTVIFVAYLSALCRNPLHTATQYALLTALASTGRTLLSSGTGYAAEALGWPAYFVSTTLAALPALLLLMWLQNRGHFRTLEADRNGIS